MDRQRVVFLSFLWVGLGQGLTRKEAVFPDPGSSAVWLTVCSPLIR